MKMIRVIFACLIVCLSLASTDVSAQSTGCCPYVDAIVVNPSMPNSSSAFKVMLGTHLPTIGKQFYINSQLVADTIFIRSCFYIGFLTAIDDYYDTLTFGPLPAGDYTIKYTAVAGFNINTCTSSDSQTVFYNLKIDGTNAVSPTSNLVRSVSYDASILALVCNDDVRAIRIFDLQGKLVNQFNNVHTGRINLSGLPSGMYVADVEEKDGLMYRIKMVR